MKKLCVFMLSCWFAVGVQGCMKPNEITWSNQTKSPDGQWLVLARTEHSNIGFGADWEQTTVELKQSFDGARPVEIFASDDDPEPPADMQAKWVSPTHLDISYEGNPHVLFQAVKAFGMDISVEHLNNR